MYVESRGGNKPTILPRATYCLASTESEANGPASVKRKSSGYFLTLAGIRSACLIFEFSPSAPTTIFAEYSTEEPFLSAFMTRPNRVSNISRKNVELWIVPPLLENTSRRTSSSSLGTTEIG